MVMASRGGNIMKKFLRRRCNIPIGIMVSLAASSASAIYGSLNFTAEVPVSEPLTIEYNLFDRG